MARAVTASAIYISSLYCTSVRLWVYVYFYDIGIIEIINLLLALKDSIYNYMWYNVEADLFARELCGTTQMWRWWERHFFLLTTTYVRRRMILLPLNSFITFFINVEIIHKFDKKKLPNLYLIVIHMPKIHNGALSNKML